MVGWIDRQIQGEVDRLIMVGWLDRQIQGEVDRPWSWWGGETDSRWGGQADRHTLGRLDRQTHHGRVDR